MRFARHVRYLGREPVARHVARFQFRRVGRGPDGHHRLAIAVERGLSLVCLLPDVDPAPSARAAPHGVFHRSALHRHARKRPRGDAHLHGVAEGQFAAFFNRFGRDVERRAFVFLHPNLFRSAPCAVRAGCEREVARQPVFGQGDFRVEGAPFVAPERVALHLLAVGVRELHRHPGFGRGVNPALAVAAVHHSRHVHGLSRAVDGAVRIELDVALLVAFASRRIDIDVVFVQLVRVAYRSGNAHDSFVVRHIASLLVALHPRLAVLVVEEA